MKLLVFYLRHQEGVSRDVQVADMITLEEIRTLSTLHDTAEAECKAKTDKEELSINEKDWPKMIEGIMEYLRKTLGKYKIPLAYVVRTETDVPAVDPAEGYATVQDEVIARAKYYTIGANGAKIFDPVSVIKRENKVWHITVKITREYLLVL